MAAQTRFLAITQREEDLRFGEFLAFANNLPFVVVPGRDQLKSALSANPDAIAFWDADDARHAGPIAELLLKTVPSQRVFAVTDDPIGHRPHLFRAPAFGHHLLRRFGDPGPLLYSKLVEASLHKRPFGLLRYFPGGVLSQKIMLKRAGQRRAAVDATQNYFIKQRVGVRLAAQVAKGVDELIMNAIFDAPVLPNGMPLHRHMDRSSDFELIEKEWVEIEVAAADDVVGVCVTDRFGSLKRETVLGFLKKNYKAEEYVLRKDDPGAGLGLNGLMHTGLSLLFVCHPAHRTEVMLFFPRQKTFRAFRTGFRFFSVLVE